MGDANRSLRHAGPLLQWEGEAPGLHAFAREDGVVYHTCAADPRALGFMVLFEQMLERVPKGGKPGVPVTRHDGYTDAAGPTDGRFLG